MEKLFKYYSHITNYIVREKFWFIFQFSVKGITIYGEESSWDDIQMIKMS